MNANTNTDQSQPVRPPIECGDCGRTFKPDWPFVSFRPTAKAAGTGMYFGVSVCPDCAGPPGGKADVAPPP